MRHGELVQLDGGLLIPASAGVNRVLASDTQGNASWKDIADWHKAIAVLTVGSAGTVGNWAVTFVTGIIGSGVLWNSVAPALNDSAQWDVGLSAGTWKVGILHGTGGSSGQIAVVLDGATQGTQEWYAAGANTYNHLDTVTGMVVAQPGKHTLALTVSGKNAASTGFNALIQAIGLQRTA